MWNYNDCSNVKMPDTETTVEQVKEAAAHFVRKANEASMSASDIAEKLSLGMAAAEDELYCPKCSTTWYKRNGIDKPFPVMKTQFALLTQHIMKCTK